MRFRIATLCVLTIGTIALAGDGVRVDPFTEADESREADWINRALRQSIVDDLTSITGLPVLRADDTSNHPRYVVSTSIQRVDGQLRVTGRIEETTGGRIIGTFRATGGERDLFAIEDSLTAQLKQVFAPVSTTQPAAVTAQPAPTPTASTGDFDGSELQRALDERDYLVRLAQRRREIYDQPTGPYGYTYSRPLFPYTSGWGAPSFWSGGWGWGWGGWCGNIIIKPGCSAGVGGNPSYNGQATRKAASFAGNPPVGVINTMVGGPIMTAGPTPSR